MSEEQLICSSLGCEGTATQALRLRDQPGHVHDCPTHAAIVREFCDVIESGDIAGMNCPFPCTGNEYLYSAQPKEL